MWEDGFDMYGYALEWEGRQLVSVGSVSDCTDVATVLVTATVVTIATCGAGSVAGVSKAFGGTHTFKETLKFSSGKALTVAGIVWAWSHTLYAFACEDPVVQANNRGYVLR